MERALHRNPQLAERGHYVLPRSGRSQIETHPAFTSGSFRHQSLRSLSETRNVRAFLEALRKLIEQDTSRAARIRFHIFGGKP